MGTRIRLSLLIGVFGLAYLGLILHLYDLQITNGQKYIARAGSQIAANLVLSAKRGGIFFTDRNNEHSQVASTKPFPRIYAVPIEISDAKEAANALSSILGTDLEALVTLLNKPKSQYALLRKKAPKAMVDAVRGVELKGIYDDTSEERFYNYGNLASHVLGFVAPDEQSKSYSGKYGVESFYDVKLAGEAGQMQGNKVIDPKDGDNIYLTIDPNIQIESQKVLEKLIKKWNAKGGSVIVQDPKSGKILAMESLPSFDPNNYGKADVASFINPAIQQVYEPGSVFKVFTMVAGIDSGKITPETTFNDTGLLELNGKKIRNWDLKAHGVVTMTNVIEESLNTGAAFAERKTGDDVFRMYVEKFGFGDKLGIDLPGEVPGSLKPIRDGSPPVNFATASFGQGVSVTPIQLISAVSSIANGGELMRPFLIEGANTKSIRRVMSEETALEVSKMMVSAVDKAKIARIKGYNVAGKTGTAQIPYKGGYKDTFINTYVGFAPVGDPRFTILIKLEEPEGAPLAGQTVVPAFRELAQFVLNYYNIPPDRTEAVIE